MILPKKARMRNKSRGSREAL